MTEIGKMIWDEGFKEGSQKGKAEILIKQLMKKFKKLPEGYSSKIKGLSEESIEIIVLDIFEIEKVEDLEKYL